MCNNVDFNILQGLVLERILADRGNDVLYFVTNAGVFKMWHSQECCEQVSIEDVVGDPRDLKGATMTMVEESCSESTRNASCKYQTWTFYRIITPQGDLTIRWCGSSNGSYSESVSFARFSGEIPKSTFEFTWSE